MRSLIGLLVVTVTQLPGQDGRRDFFESRVRPLLAERCHACHGPEKQKSGLRLDHGDFVHAGGTRGPAVVPGSVDDSRMLAAVSYDDPDLQMPPKRKLSADEIAVLRRWVEDGAFWPDEPRPTARTGDAAAFDLAERRETHWCWQPLRQSEPPTIDDPAWSTSAIDRFVASRARAAGLSPNPPASRRTWLRRVTFDLTGLPPTPEEQFAFVNSALVDEAAKAEVVDRLLASPHFGERWARHWMDLLRYAETMGHEFDFQMQEAWRYRDYLIRAFNEDVPYDRLIHEHIAGDLLDDPRRQPDSGLNESAIATASWWFMDQTHSPVDSYQSQSDRIDNAIDVFSKSFLALTVSCARCHDHKFDAISTADYYALYGVVRSSRHVNRLLDPPRPELHEAVRGASRELGSAVADALDSSAADVAACLQTAAVAPPRPSPPKDKKEREAAEATWREELDRLAFESGVDGDVLRAFVDALARPEIARDPHHPLHAWVGLAAHGERVEVPARWQDVAHRSRAAAAPADGEDFVDFRRQDYEGWSTDGPAFGVAPTMAGQGARARGDRILLDALTGRWAHSGRHSLRAMGTLFSPEFRIRKRYVHVLVAGQAARFNIVVNGFNIIRDPIYGRLKQNVDHPDARWRTIDVAMWMGDQAYLQFVDMNVPDPSGGGYPNDGWIAVQRVVFSNDRAPGEAIAPLAEMLGTAAPASLAGVARRYSGAVRRAVAAWREDRATRHERALMAWLLDTGLLGKATPGVADALQAWRAAEDALPLPTIIQSVQDGTGLDEPVHLRGGHRNPGDPVPRRFLTALGAAPLNVPDGSGRLGLARAITAPDNPLTPRAAVNRVWHHLLGRGIAPTVDNFGVLGQPPTHPDLLDWLAVRFVEDGWSIKQLVRRIVLSRTYGMSSAPDPADEESDPDNLLLHRASIRRLQGEIIRDAMLAVSGRLDREMFGPSVPVHLTRFMEGRGRPGRSGPHDGAGRRSVYLEVRRNFLNPMFLAWDTPAPFSSVGRRSVSNVPAQALSLLNDPFVHQQAELWATRIVGKIPAAAERVAVMYREALCREPTAAESEAAIAFVNEQAAAYGADANGDRRAWKDLAHVLFNVKDFVFVE